jgi:hypothetical protein
MAEDGGSDAAAAALDPAAVPAHLHPEPPDDAPGAPAPVSLSDCARHDALEPPVESPEAQRPAPHRPQTHRGWSLRTSKRPMLQKRTPLSAKRPVETLCRAPRLLSQSHSPLLPPRVTKKRQERSYLCRLLR